LYFTIDRNIYFWADKENAWLKQVRAKVDSYQPGVGIAIKMLQEQYNVADIIALFRHKPSYPMAAKLGTDLMKAKYDQKIKKALLAKVRTGALTPNTRAEVIQENKQLDALTVMKIGQKVKS
jgi:hypothetical protein